MNLSQSNTPWPLRWLTPERTRAEECVGLSWCLSSISALIWRHVRCGWATAMADGGPPESHITGCSRAFSVPDLFRGIGRMTDTASDNSGGAVGASHVSSKRSTHPSWPMCRSGRGLRGKPTGLPARRPTRASRPPGRVSVLDECDQPVLQRPCQQSGFGGGRAADCRVLVSDPGYVGHDCARGCLDPGCIRRVG